LEQDKSLVDRLGSGFVDAFTRLKRQELDRFARAVTDWEFREYSWLL
jgi:glutamine synthetase